MEEWKKHSSSTGGYYRCTRYEVIQQVEEQTKEMTVEVFKSSYTEPHLFICTYQIKASEMGVQKNMQRICLLWSFCDLTWTAGMVLVNKAQEKIESTRLCHTKTKSNM